MSAPRCQCGSGLSIDADGKSGVWHCRCPRCRARAQRDGAVVDVDGYGKTLEAAVKDFEERKNTF